MQGGAVPSITDIYSLATSVPPVGMEDYATAQLACTICIMYCTEEEELVYYTFVQCCTTVEFATTVTLVTLLLPIYPLWATRSLHLSLVGHWWHTDCGL